MPDPKEAARLYSFAQVGLEMAVPIAVGAWLDGHYGLRPWGVTIGAVLGLGGGIVHLLVLLRRQEAQDSRPPRQDPS